MATRISSLSEIPSVRSYLNRIGADPRSLVEAVVRELHGKYWRDTVRIRVNARTGEITTWDARTRKPAPDYAPTSDEQKLIKTEIENYIFPTAKKTLHYTLPDHLKDATIYPFKDLDGSLIMIVQRIEGIQGGEKRYVPWTLFDDDEWRQCEPGGPLPLYGLEKLKGWDTVFIHEGPKKAEHCNKLFHEAYTAEEIALRDAHPWVIVMRSGIHLGFHGGALAPYRTMWEVLRAAGVKHVYIIPDNDAPGISAVPIIAERLRDMVVYTINWNKEFGASFDMAEPFPPAMFETDNGTTHYIGPAFEELLRPGTWATDRIENGKKKPIIILRDAFAQQWRYVSGANRYINLQFPWMCHAPEVFDRVVKDYSDAARTSELLNSAPGSKAFSLVYRPDRADKRLTYADNAPTAVNIYVAPKIKSRSGNSDPFEKFIDYMFVNKEERHQVRRWLATLIAHPEIRMAFSQLWVSPTQGIGKNTLGEHILAPLVGLPNCSFPSEQMIVDSQFNSWLVCKRLIFVGEIYSGHSWKAYNKLKSFITDKTIEVNQKYIDAYKIDNWAHVIACSNSEKALKMEDGDRRWYCPELAVKPWTPDKFVALYSWIKRGGLQIVKHWAETFGDYIVAGERAPMTASKKQMIEDSLSDEERLMISWATAFDSERPDHEMVVSDKIIKNFLMQDNHLQMRFASALDMRKVLAKHGWLNPSFQLNIDGLAQSIMMSPACAGWWREQPPYDKLDKQQQQERRDWLRKRLRSMADPEGKGVEFINRTKQMGV